MKLEVEQVKKIYNGSTEALKGVSFVSEKSEFISVVGSSGSGKTTLFGILNGSVRPDEGRVIIDGTDILRSSGKSRRVLQRQTGTVYQDFCLVENVSCIENVLNASLGEMNAVAGILGLFGRERREEARQLLIKVGIGDKCDEQVRNLSGGQKQRVAIARALMQKPKFLLADEPIASLDPVTGRQILELLRTIQQSERITVIMNSHNPELSAEFSDRIIGLGNGELVFDGNASELTPEKLEEIYAYGKDEA